MNAQSCQEKAVIRSILEYLVGRTKSNATLKKIASLLTGNTEQASVGLVLTERLINIPSEVVPPMYTMLLEEISWAVEAKEPYSFTHYLIISKIYCEIDSLLDDEDDTTRRHKKPKKVSKHTASEVFYFHPEDEVLQQHAELYGTFEYLAVPDKGQSDSKRAFQEMGIKPQGHMILIEASKFEAAVKGLQACFS